MTDELNELTDEVLAELERLHADATPGDWKRGQTSLHVNCYHPDKCFNIYSDQCDVTEPCAKLSRADASLIVTSRNRLPALLAAARRCRELEAELRIIGHKLYALNELAKATVFRYNKGVLDELLRRIETLVQMEPTQ